MRVAIIGSRSLAGNKEVAEKMEEMIMQHLQHSPTIVSGGAEGVDTLAQRLGKKYGLDVIVFKPYFKLAGCEYKIEDFFVRNRQIVDNCDRLWSFWDGVSGGSKYTTEYAKKRRKDVSELVFD